MNVSEAIHTRRAYRSIRHIEINRETVEDLSRHAQLSASCNNNQPWRYVFVYEKNKLDEIYETTTRGNTWVKQASMIRVAFSKSDDDCQVHERIYHHFDLGMAMATMILRATELGLVAHLIAGFSPIKVREVLQIPDEYTVLALIIVGKKMQEIHPSLSEEQRGKELQRPERKPLGEWAYHNMYQGK